MVSSVTALSGLTMTAMPSIATSCSTGVDAVGLGLLDLLVLDGARCVSEVHGAVDERGDAGTGAAALDGDHDAGVLLHEHLGPRLCHVHERVGALDVDRTGELLTPQRSPPRCSPRRLIVVAAAGKPKRAESEGDDQSENEPLVRLSQSLSFIHGCTSRASAVRTTDSGHARAAHAPSGCSACKTRRTLRKTHVTWD